VTELLSRIERIEEGKSDEQPIEILKAIEQDNRFSKQEIRQYVSDFYHLPQEQEDNYCQQKKIRLLSNTIITTNYDNAFEIACPDLNPIFFEKDDTENLFATPNKPILFKLHGCCDDANSKLILFPSDYNKLYDGIRTNDKNVDRKHILLSFYGLIINRTLLFLGYGMGDFQINNIFLGIKQILEESTQKHFIIIEREKFRDELKDFLIPIFIERIKVNGEDKYDYSIINATVEKLIIEKESIQFKKSYEGITEKLKHEKGLTKRNALKLSLKGLELYLHKDFEKSIECFREAENLNSQDWYTFNAFGFVLFELAKIRKDKRLLEESIEKFKKAIQINLELDIEHVDVINNCGLALADLAEMNQDETLFLQANEKCEKATQLNPEDADNFYNWGNALSGWAEMKQDEMLFMLANEKYAKATELNPEHNGAFCNWGLTLYYLAEIKNDEALILQSFEKYEKAAQINAESAKTFNNWGNSFCYLARIKEDENLFEQAFDKYEKATQIHPEYADAFFDWGDAVSDLAKIKEDENLFEQSFEKYEKATQINPKCVEGFNNWGNALSDLAKMKEDQSLFEQAFEKYEIATQINPDNADVFYNWGNSFCYLARIKEDENLFKLAFDKYEIATQINPENADAFYDWGNALSDLAKMKEDQTLFEQAFKKYEKATRINPKNTDAFCNWGLAFSDLAKMKQAEVFFLFMQAGEKYEKAIQINPDDADVLYNWGDLLSNLAEMKRDENLFEQAFEKWKKACRINPEYSYNLSCVYASLGEKEKALHCLEESLKHKTIESEFILNDSDWENYLADEDFIHLINKYTT